MASLYSNENVPIEVVIELRRLGHDVLTSVEAGNANSGIPDPMVLEFARSTSRIVLTNNRRDFIRLHRQGTPHACIVVFSFQADTKAIASRIDVALCDPVATGRFLARIDGIGHSMD